MSDSSPRSHLHSMGADVPWAPDAPFILLTFDDLEDERRALQVALPARAGSETAPPTGEIAFRLAGRLERLARSGWLPSADELRCALAPLPESESRSLDRRLNQIGHAIAYGRRVHGRDYDATPVALVSHRWDRRWATLVSGALCPAYVGFLSIESFPS